MSHFTRRHFLQQQAFGLGGLALSLEGLKARDRLVTSTALMHKVPVAITLAGGYAIDLDDTITIHANTAKAIKEVLASVGWAGCAPARRGAVPAASDPGNRGGPARSRLY